MIFKSWQGLNQVMVKKGGAGEGKSVIFLFDVELKAQNKLFN